MSVCLVPMVFSIPSLEQAASCSAAAKAVDLSSVPACTGPSSRTPSWSCRGASSEASPCPAARTQLVRSGRPS